MRAPELQLIDRLEQLTKELKQATLEYQKNFFSILKTRLEADTTAAEDKWIITLNLVNALIARANSVPADSDSAVEGTRMSGQDFEQLLHSLCATCSQREKIKQLVMASFFSFLKDCRESIEKICTQYGLAMPADNTPVVVDFAGNTHVHNNTEDGSGDNEEENRTVTLTLFQLQEMQYMLNQMLHASADELARLHPIRALPFMRHMQISDDSINRIQSSRQELTEKLSSSIKEAQNKLRAIMVEKKYPETTETVSSIIAKQTQLLVDIEYNIGTLRTLRLLMSGLDGTTESLQISLEIFPAFSGRVNITQQQIVDFNNLNKAMSRIGYELHGSNIAEESRFYILDKIFNELIAQMTHHQVAAGESCSDFDLKNYLNTLKEKTQSTDTCFMLNIQNIATISTLSEQFTAEVDAFIAACRPTGLQQTQSPTSTAPAAALFGSGSTVAARSINRNPVAASAPPHSSDSDGEENNDRVRYQ